MLQKLPKC